jgi:hypothetical protein
MSSVKRLSAADNPILVFMYYVYQKNCVDHILVVATDVWDIVYQNTEWMRDDIFPSGRTHTPGIDLLDSNNVWKFPAGVEGERAAYRKMCQIYADQLKERTDV